MRNNVIANLVILFVNVNDPQRKRAIKYYKNLVKNLSESDFKKTIKNEIRRNPQAMAEKFDNENAWDCFEVVGWPICEKLINSWSIPK